MKFKQNLQHNIKSIGEVFALAALTACNGSSSGGGGGAVAESYDVFFAYSEENQSVWENCDAATFDVMENGDLRITAEGDAVTLSETLDTEWDEHLWLDVDNDLSYSISYTEDDEFSEVNMYAIGDAAAIEAADNIGSDWSGQFKEDEAECVADL